MIASSSNTTTAELTNSAGPQQGKVAYLVSRFPKLTETFVLYELLAVRELGADVELYALQRERTKLMHPEARRLMDKVHFHPWVSFAILRAHLATLWRQPRVYLQTLWILLRANWGCQRYLMGAVVFFPKTVYFAQQMAASGVTHIHAHFASHPAAAAFVIHRLTGIPFSFTAHGSDLHRAQQMLAEKADSAEFVIAISEYNKRFLVRACQGRFDDKTHVIHCGVDTDLFRPLQDTESDSTSRTLQVVCLGMLHEVKGQSHLLDACRILREREVNCRCHFIGDGPDRNELERRVAQFGLADRVIFHGQQVQADVLRLLQNADVVSAPSVATRGGRREGIPVALMEAMATGAAVVASDLSGIPELVESGRCGLLVPPGDASALADALERLATAPALRRRLGRAARQKVLSKFALSENASRVAARFQMGGPSQ